MLIYPEITLVRVITFLINDEFSIIVEIKRCCIMKKMKTNFLKLELTPVYQIAVVNKFGPVPENIPTTAETISFTGQGVNISFAK